MIGLLLLPFCIQAEEKKNPPMSVCYLINPPNQTIDWNFGGNQVIFVSIHNFNVLPVMITLECNTGYQKKRNLYILPLKDIKDIRYDIFSKVPVGWRFFVSTISDAASVAVWAIWNEFKIK